MNDTLVRPETRPTPSTESGRVAHIVISTDPDKNGVATVMEARMYGLEVLALCGVRWVPQHDPKNYPLCQACKEIKERAGGDPLDDIKHS